MKDEYGYIDDKPFKELNRKEQELSIINSNDEGIEFKVFGDNKFSFGDYNEKCKQTLYAVNTKLNAITAYRLKFKKSYMSFLSYNILESDLYLCEYGFRNENGHINHFTDNTKISKIEYFNDSIVKAFGKNWLKKLERYRKNDVENVKLNFNRIKEEKIGELKIDNNVIKIYIKYDYIYTNEYRDCEKIVIIDNSAIILKFKNGASFDLAYRYILILDSVFYLMTLVKRRHKKIFISDFRKNKYSFIDSNRIRSNVNSKDRNFLICDSKETKEKFINIFYELCKIKNEEKNAIFPFAEFDVQRSSAEIEFLEYYRVIEFIDTEKRKNEGKGKNKKFLIDILEEFPKLKKHFFGEQNINEIEEEIRTLRNYYSHDGYYLKKLPIPTDNPKRYKDVTVNWLSDVIFFIKIVAYLKVYELCGINVDWSSLIYNI